MGDIYSPFTEGVGKGLRSPKARKPLEASPFILQETPYLSNLSILLKEANNRPVTFFNKQGFFVFARLMEFTLAPVFAVSGYKNFHNFPLSVYFLLQNLDQYLLLFLDYVFLVLFTDFDRVNRDGRPA